MSAERRARLEDARSMRALGQSNLADAILTRLAREVAADPTTDTEVRADIEAILAAGGGK